MSSATRHTEAAATKAPAQPTTPTVGGPAPCPCELLTAMIRTRKLIDGMPAEPLAANDLWDELGQLAESITAARSHAELLRTGCNRPPACPDDRRRSSRLNLNLDIIHDRDPAEILAVVLARTERLLAGYDVDVADITTGWEDRPLG